MANVTAFRADGRQEGDLNDGVADGAIYGGTLLSFGSNGKVHSAVAGEPFAGVAIENAQNGETVRYWAEGIVDVDCAAAVGVNANLGKLVVVTDNHTVALVASETAEKIVGQIVNINSTTSVRVKL